MYHFTDSKMALPLESHMGAQKESMSPCWKCRSIWDCAQKSKWGLSFSPRAQAWHSPRIRGAKRWGRNTLSYPDLLQADMGMGGGWGIHDSQGCLLLHIAIWGARIKENELMYPSISGASSCGTTCLIQASLCHCACVDTAHPTPSSSCLYEKTLTPESSEEV